ncbi:MAG: hypothetical protein Q8M07_25950 [Prosthecobacter sp.]|nr:hypothetical protein [Prosthecobacter sp.]
MKNNWFKYAIFTVIGIAVGAGFTTLFVRQCNNSWLIRPALASSVPQDRTAEYLLSGPGWQLPLKVLTEKTEIKIMLPGSGQASSAPAVNIWIGKDGVRSIAAANSAVNGVSISKNKTSTVLFNELVVHTPSNNDSKVLMKVDTNLDGVFENDILTDK